MPRQKEFAVEEALDRAVEVFRRHGYEGTSMRDLQEAMGIGRQSIYDTFGDKKQLFVKALERYAERGRSTIAAKVLSNDSSLPELREYFDQLIEFLTPRDRSSSCLVASTILELGTQEREVASCCRNNQKTLRGGIRALLERARERGEVRPDLDCDAASLLLMTQVYGFTVLARNGASRAELHRSLQQLIDTFVS